MEGIEKVLDRYAYTRNKVDRKTTYYRCFTFKLTQCIAKLSHKEGIDTIKGVHKWQFHVPILPSEDKNNTNIQSPSSFVGEYLKVKAPKLDKMPFIVYEVLPLTMQKKYAGCVYTAPSKKTFFYFLLSRRGHFWVADLIWGCKAE
ncbi:hypothetical protein HZS_7878 [Henneguya salminicola]|nr:hypothetical protein HZS_7878 [Henneguya salminicola]